MYLIIPFKIGVFLQDDFDIDNSKVRTASTQFKNAIVGNAINNKGYMGKNSAPYAFGGNLWRVKKGIHLHFNIPDALTRGVSDSNSTVFPNVPNRWLIVRTYRDLQNNLRQKNFLVESNFFTLYDSEEINGLKQDYTDSVAIPAFKDTKYDSRERKSHSWRYLGRTLNLQNNLPTNCQGQNGFTEASDIGLIDGNAKKGYLKNLTALGEGDAMFSAYYPKCHSVFGFHDADTSDIETNTKVSYSVIGYYYDPKNSPLYNLNGKKFHEKLDLMGLTFDGIDPNKNYNSTELVTFGTVNVEWKGEDFLYNREYAERYYSANISPSVSFGLTSEEALSATVNQAVLNKNTDTGEDFLTALQYDLDDYAKQVDGNFFMEDEIHSRRFEVNPSLGIIKQIEILKEINDIKILGDIPKIYAELCEINRKYANKSRQINFTQDKLYVMWEHYMDAYEPVTGKEVNPKINYSIPTRSKCKEVLLKICDEIKNLISEHSELEKKSKELTEKIKNCNAYKEGYLNLTDISEAPFYSPKPPSLMLSGTGLKRIFAFGENGHSREDGKVLCEVSDVNITENVFGFKTTDGKNITSNNIFEATKIKPLTSLPTRLDKNLYLNLFCAGLILNNNISGYKINRQISSLFNSQPLSNPILFIDWRVNLIPAGNKINKDETKLLEGMSFKYNTTNYTFDGDISKLKTSLTFSNFIPVTPHALLNFSDKLTEYLEKTENKNAQDTTKNIEPLSPATLKEMNKKIRGWSFISQNLNGFTENFLGREFSVQFPVDIDLEDDIATEIAKYVKDERPAINGLWEFMPIRSGFFRLSKLNLTDTFGYSSNVTEDGYKFESNNYYSYIFPRKKINDVSHFELPPIFSSPARLSANFISSEISATGKKIFENAFEETSPVIAVLLPDILNNHLKIFTGGKSCGEYVGELKVVFRNGSPECRFLSKNGDSVINSGNLILDNYIKSFTGNPYKPAFSELMTLIDFSISNKIPTSNLIWGRPLILAKMAVSLDFYGGVNFSVMQGNFDKYDTKGAESLKIPLYFGDIRRVSDGFIGLYEDDFDGNKPTENFKNLRPLWGAEFEKNSQYISKIPFEISNSDNTKYITVLSEADSDINISSGILPVKKVRSQLPVNTNLDYCTEINPVIGSEDELSLPLMAENKEISFQYRNPDYTLQKAEIYSNFSTLNADNIIMDGMLVVEKSKK
jgi:hypothetical protein